MWFYEVCAGFFTLPPDGYLGRLPTKKLNEYPVIWRTNRQKSLSSTSSSSDMNDNVHDFMFLFSFSIQGLSYFLSLPFLHGRTLEAFRPISYILPTSCPLQSFSILCGMIEMGIKLSLPANLQARDGYKSLLLQAMASLLSPKADHPSAWLPLPLEARLAIRENNSRTLMSFDQVVSFNISGASSTRAEFLHRQHA